MNDYLVDEKLMREIKDIPSPLPKRNHPNINSQKTSNQATLKKELNDLEYKYKSLDKAYNKLDKKCRDLQEEIKLIKSNNENYMKEINILQITNEKMNSDKQNMESVIEENKNYIRKIESRLVNGAKNQHLVEINNKLRKEIEELKVHQY